MANRAYLVGSNHSDTAGPSAKGINYDPDTEILAGASTRIPILWLSLFAESHLKFHEVQGFKIPSFVGESSIGMSLLQQRKSSLNQTFPDCQGELAAWEKLIEGANFKFYKVDCTEIWDLDPDQFCQRLPSALRWFTSGASEDFENLLGIAEIPNLKKGVLSRLFGSAGPGYDHSSKKLTA